MASIVYLISGANRGIGLGLVAELAKRDNVVIFAGSRTNERGEGTANLYKLVDAQPDKVFIVKLLSGNEANNAAAVEFVKKKAGRLDVVIANAGVARSAEAVINESIDEMRVHWDVNVGGPHILFKTVYSLLCHESLRDASDTPPKFVTISSTAGSIELAGAIKYVAYGASKAAVNYLMRKIHFEHENDGLVAFPMCPGAVETDMWAMAKKYEKGIETRHTVQSLDENAKNLMKVIDGATRESCGGKFMNHEGGISPW